MALELASDLAPSETDRLEQAEALVRSFCGWHIAPSRTETVTVVGTPSATLVLPSLHVTAISAIAGDGSALTFGTDYRWSQMGVLTHASRWAYDEVTVTLTHGFTFPPADVVAVVQAVAQRAVDNPGSLTRKQVGPFGDSYSLTGSGQVATLALLDAEKEALRRYRIPGVA